MAQRTGAERFLRRLLNATSAGVIPALVVVLCLSGCGGGSSADATRTSPGTNSQSSSGGEGSGETGASDSNAAAAATGAVGGESGAQAGGSPGTASDPGGDPSTGKHGPRVPVPKGKPEPGITPKQRSEATIASISLQSPSVPPAQPDSVSTLPRAYACDGEDSWPALTWQGVPEGTAELALFAMNSQPVDGKIFFDWAVAGIDPSLTGIETGKLPKGTAMGVNSFGGTGYQICPNPGGTETYYFALYALPQHLGATRGFDPAALRQQILQVSGNVGLMAVSYAR